MAITKFQLNILQIISRNRVLSGESYFAGGAALNSLIEAPRLSNDIDLFHDTSEAVRWAVGEDSEALRAADYQVDIEIDREAFVEALVSVGEEYCRLQWVQDSAYRFFPLAEHPDFGLVLHPFDLATNKVLALVGRAVPRDWVDIIECDSRLQPLGYLVWAAAGKDPGLNPSYILDQAARSVRYTEIELSEVNFVGTRPTAAELSIGWRRTMESARSVVEALPWQRVGECVIDRAGELIRLDAASLTNALKKDEVRFHAGSLYGAFPVFV